MDRISLISEDRRGKKKVIRRIQMKIRIIQTTAISTGTFLFINKNGKIIVTTTFSFFEDNYQILFHINDLPSPPSDPTTARGCNSFTTIIMGMN